MTEGPINSCSPGNEDGDDDRSEGSEVMSSYLNSNSSNDALKLKYHELIEKEKGGEHQVNGSSEKGEENRLEFYRNLISLQSSMTRSVGVSCLMSAWYFISLLLSD